MTDQERARLAELETAQARAGQSKAEFERNVVVGNTVNGVVHRADNAVSEANIRASRAESQASQASSEGTFSATLSIILLAVVVFGIGGYFMWWQPNHTTSAATNTIIQRTEKTTEKTTVPTVIQSPSPNVNVKVVAPPPAPPVEEKVEEKKETLPVKPESTETPVEKTPPDEGGSTDKTEGNTSGK